MKYHFISFVAGQNKRKTLQFHKPRNRFTCKPQRMEKKKRPHNQISNKDTNLFSSQKRLKKRMLSCYQTENKHATFFVEKIILKLFKNKNFTKRKEKEFTYISLGVCALCFLNLHCTTFRKKKKKRSRDCNYI